MLGPTGLVSAMAPKSVLIETSTVSAEASAEVGAAALARGIAYLRAPVSGNASIVHTGALGHLAEARAQWHSKTSWRAAAPSGEREAELNWRLKRDTSSGLIGEIGIHQIDTTTSFVKARPLSVTGFGGRCGCYC